MAYFAEMLTPVTFVVVRSGATIASLNLALQQFFSFLKALLFTIRMSYRCVCGGGGGDLD